MRLNNVRAEERTKIQQQIEKVIEYQFISREDALISKKKKRRRSISLPLAVAKAGPG
jgi:hypothetical protein